MTKQVVPSAYFRDCAWTASDYQKLQQFLRDHADLEYQHFNERTIPGAEGTTYGVRLSILRPLSKEIAKGPHWLAYLNSHKESFYEETLLEGMVISYVKMPAEEKFRWIDHFIPQISNWALCDCFINKNLLAKMNAEFWPRLPLYLQSENPWSKRFAYGVMMSYYLEPEFIEEVFKFILAYPSDFYYVQMMKAWLLADAFIKQRDAAWKFLKQNKKALGAELMKMTVRKIRDSYRVSEADKNLVLALKEI